MYDKNSFLLERYKYILARKQTLNDATFKIATIYQVLLLALGAGQYNVILQWKSVAITADIASLFSLCITIMIFALSALILTLLMGGVASWLKYRRDEANIELTVHGTNRDPVNFASIFRWYETYLGGIVILTLVGWIYVYKNYISVIF
ncbi:hypothetical protein [Pseudomonas syringae]|uniref:hypothetical protein n=1 Tax=Pseudomonas syringae TaxID=317 RepID=UPI00200B15EC|nr:hypothetical protein [Pseudomonas syringae]MCK9744742.1 hypothetical protein [Pseudomonas syringae pv. syringae]MCK9769756.1 hypothetical protein [Pseudomonas syringae pv. syringae]